MRRAFRAALLVLPIALLPVALVACGGGSALSLEDYFTEVRELRAAREERQADIDAEYEDKLNASEFSDQVVEDYASYFPVTGHRPELRRRDEGSEAAG